MSPIAISQYCLHIYNRIQLNQLEIVIENEIINPYRTLYTANGIANAD